MNNNKQSRKWLLTLNNPLEKDFSHDRIREELLEIKPCIYYCLSDEIGGKEKTHHTHVYIACSSAVRFSTIKHRFPFAHIDLAKGTSQQNRDYVFKEGKWESSQKNETKLSNTQLEWGEMPVERQGARNDLADLYDRIKSGASNFQIMEDTPEYMLHLDKIERVRQAIKFEEYKMVFRLMEVTYIFGAPGAGKSRYVLENHGYENVYRVTDYKYPFDGYSGQEVLILDDFYYEHFRFHDMLNILDGYPLSLPCRYANKQACFTKVYLISNIPLNQQYPQIQLDEPSLWEALLRRIHKIVKFPISNEDEIKEQIEGFELI